MPPHASRRLIAAVICSAVLAGCGGSKHPSGQAPTSTNLGGTVGGSSGSPPPIPAHGAYLGAWINPVKKAAGGDTNSRELAQLPTFRSATGDVPAILSIYTPWTDPAPISHLQSIVAQGAIPLIAWGCASPADINAGNYDTLISNYAASLKSFGHPVFLRWFWEMNLHVQKESACIGSAGPSGFVTAWRRVWTIFHRVGASNVALVWCPGITGGLANLERFFPGANYVDWIAVDGYDRKNQGQAAFGDIFGKWYDAFAKYGKPMMIGETGAQSQDQAPYLQGIAASLPTQFPLIKAVIYFDARGPAAAWQLVGAGLQAFGALASNPYFSARA